MNPIDLAPPGQLPIVQNGSVKNVTLCSASYTYLTLDPTNFQGFDMILGDAFLRSVYASYVFAGRKPSFLERVLMPCLIDSTTESIIPRIAPRASRSSNSSPSSTPPAPSRSACGTSTAASPRRAAARRASARSAWAGARSARRRSRSTGTSSSRTRTLALWEGRLTIARADASRRGS